MTHDAAPSPATRTGADMAQRFACWSALQADSQQQQQKSLLQRFADDPARAERFSAEAAGLRLDYSKNFIDDNTRQLLLTLADQASLRERLQALMRGDAINHTEKRAALHTALRAPHDASPQGDVVSDTLAKMAALVDQIHRGAWRGYSNETITDVVNIGIGGSDLGPQMAVHALKPFHTGHVRLHFVSNVDPSCLQDLLRHLNPARTLFIIASKSFTTLETLQNAQAAQRWLMQFTQDSNATARHFIAVSTAIEKVRQFGIAADNILPMWDWVGGRYSLWSAIGLPIALAVGMDHFTAFLQGAHAMDQHTLHAPFEANIPVLMGLLGVWYSSFWQTRSHVVLPYDHYLRFFPDYLQQLDMESNGKQVNRAGENVPYHTGPVIWGSVGTNGQHSFHQLLHQGTQLIPADFIVTLSTHQTDCADQHRHLLANGLAQSQALMCGKNRATVEAELRAQGLSDSEIAFLTPHKVIPGNRPSNLISIDQLTPATLGALIATYEHKVFVQSVLWDINPFDQWGVELGKQLSTPIYRALNADSAALAEQDGSTAAIIARYLARP